jgi:hypothetical protein
MGVYLCLVIIKDSRQKDFQPLDPEGQARMLVDSPAFGAMIGCFASNIAQDALRGYTSNKIMPNNAPATKYLDPADRKIRIFLATDAPAVRPSFAKILIEAVKSHLVADSKHATPHSISESQSQPELWDITVDHFSEDLPAAHFLDWVQPSEQVRSEEWRRLAGTAAEWIMLSQGKRMLTAKGVKGGSRLRPSSFALSAAAFGATPEVSQLMNCEKSDSSSSMPQMGPGMSLGKGVGRSRKTSMHPMLPKERGSLKFPAKGPRTNQADNMGAHGSEYSCSWRTVASFNSS